MRKLLLVVLAVAAQLSAVGVAAADEPPSLATTQPDTWIPPTADSQFKHLTLTLNPLSLLVGRGRIGANVEYLPTRHHAIVLNPYFEMLNFATPEPKTTYTTFGAELGYHYYTGDTGANGLYFGPSLIGMSTTARASSMPNVSSSIFMYGAAFDVGYQYVAKNGFTMGGGFGAMVLAVNDPHTVPTSFYGGSVVSPRVLFTIGYSF